MTCYRQFGLLAALLLGLLGCSKQDESALMSKLDTEIEGMSAESLLAWQAYLDSLPLEEIQDECLPQRYQARRTYQGTVVLFHGYSACPQQFWEVADQLADRGFDVLLPLLPGHGRIRSNSGQDEVLDELPQAHEWQIYLEHAQEMANVVRASDGIRAVGGLSVGGTLATYGFLAPELAGTWSRALILAPMYNSTEGIARIVPEFVGNIPFLNQWLGMGWGEQCWKDSTTPYGPNDYRRGGFCSFKLTHLAALQSLGQYVKKHILEFAQGDGRIAEDAEIQLVFTDFDALLRSRSLNQTLDQLSGEYVAGSMQMHACSYGGGVPHSFLSRYDAELHTDPERHKAWLPSLVDGASNFLASGTPFPTRQEPSVYPLAPACAYDSMARPSSSWPVPSRP